MYSAPVFWDGNESLEHGPATSGRVGHATCDNLAAVL